MKKQNKVTIKSIDYADPNDPTHVVDLVHLTDGATLHLDAGKATHSIYDQSLGPVQIGAELTRTVVEGPNGEFRTHVFGNDEVSIDILN